MKKLIVFLIALFLCFSYTYADGHKDKKGPQFEYFGSLSYVDITRFNDYKQNFIADLPDGSFILANGDKGKIASPCADFGKLQKERTIDLDKMFNYYGGWF